MFDFFDIAFRATFALWLIVSGIVSPFVFNSGCVPVWPIVLGVVSMCSAGAIMLKDILEEE